MSRSKAPSIQHSTVDRVKVTAVDGLWTAEQAQSFLNIRKSKFYDMVKRGEICSYRIGINGPLRFRPADVMNCVIPTPGTGKIQI